MTLPAEPPGAASPERPRLPAAELLSDPDYRRYWIGSTAFALGVWG